MPQDPDRFTETHPDPVATGGTLTIVYVNSARANETVNVVARNGNGDEHELEIQLDGDGRGSRDFDVPGGWENVKLTGPNTAQHDVPVLPPPG